MYKKLIEQINTLRIDGLSNYKTNIINKTIDDVIKIIKELEPKPYPLPNCEGIWYNNEIYYSIYYIDTPDKDLFVYWDYEACQYIACEEGEWYLIREGYV